MKLITCTLSYFCSERSEFTTAQKDQLLDLFDENGINYMEHHHDIALRQSFEPNMIDVMNRFFSEQFGSHYLQRVFTIKNYSADRNIYPLFIFLDTAELTMYELKLSGSQQVFLGSIDYLHQEVSALADALGLVLTERDNYPGGKQKLAFGLIDMTWSALQSKFPLIIY